MSLAVKPVYSGRVFSTVAYLADSSGQLRPERPVRCPASGEDSIPCHLRASKWRERKFGPGYALVVFRCFAHGSSFTVYPPDWTPYARRSFVVLSPDGADGVHEDGPMSGWAGTVFQAVVDGAAGRAWPEEARFFEDDRGLVPGGVFRTQCRHIHGALALFAIACSSDVRAREKVAATLDLDVPFLGRIVNRARDGPWWRSAAKAVGEILSILGAPGRRHLLKLVGLGRDLQYWGPLLLTT
jgi:hypothetical protein